VLLVAIENSYTDIVELLIASGADVNKTDNNSGQTPLLVAVHNDAKRIAALLIANGANVDSEADVVPGPKRV
jgi:ankyrin repeat protein